MAHTPRRNYSREEQVDAWKLDLLADIESAETQAENGPFYPERGITDDSLRIYAADCRRQLENPEGSLREALKGSGTPL